MPLGPPTTSPAVLDDEIAQLRARLNELERQRALLLQAQAEAAERRPTGIPPSWKPKFEGVGASLYVYAWYDPNKLGE